MHCRFPDGAIPVANRARRESSARPGSNQQTCRHVPVRFLHREPANLLDLLSHSSICTSYLVLPTLLHRTMILLVSPLPFSGSTQHTPLGVYQLVTEQKCHPRHCPSVSDGSIPNERDSSSNAQPPKCTTGRAPGELPAQATATPALTRPPRWDDLPAG